MSKGLGQKIVIKFDKPLVGDVTGNQAAFTVTGDEYKYVNGPLLNRGYTVESTERAPASLFYQEAFNGVSDGVEVGSNGLVLTLPIPVFSPTDITGLQLWLDASQITGLADNAQVATWSDMSGNNRHATQSTSDKRPLYKASAINNKPALKFDGLNDEMSGQISISQPITGFFVSRVSTESILFDGANTNARFYVINMWATNQARLFAGEVLLSPNSAASANVPSVITAIASGGNSSIRVNGGNLASGSAGIHNLSGYLIGNDIGTYNKFLNGDVAEIIIYNTALSTTDRQEVESYLMTKYGIGGV